MIDPQMVAEMMKSKTSSLLVPTTSASATPTALPTVIPGPSISYELVGAAGNKTLWVVFIIMLLSAVSFTFLATRVPVQKRLFHVITTFIVTFAALSYYAMATGDGNAFATHIVKQSHEHVPDTVEHVYRQVFWARYVDWAVTTPLLLLDLGLLAGINGASLSIAIVADVIMVLFGLFAAFGTGAAQLWGYYAIACIAYLVIVYQLAISGRRAVQSKGAATSKLFASIGGFTLILWTLYPVVWAIGDGARLWGVDAEIISYAVLDVLAKPVFGFWLLFAHRSAPAIEGFWSNGLAAEGSLRIGDDE